MFDSVVTTVLDTNRKVWFRLFLTVIAVLSTIVVDEYIGFSEYFFLKRKAEAISALSTAIKDTTLTVRDRQALATELHWQVNRQSLKRSLKNGISDATNYITSGIWSNSQFRIETHPTHRPPEGKHDWSVLVVIGKVLLQFVSAAFWCIVFVIFILFGDDTLTDKAYYTFILLAIGGIFAGATLLIPPYTFGTFVRYALNFLYGTILSVIVWLIIPKASSDEK